MRTKEVVNMMKELSDYQKDRIETIMNDFIQLNDFCETKTPTACPNCGKIHKRFIKNGFANKKQRYQCKECGKKFVYDKGQLTYHSQQTADILADLISDTLQMNPISYTAAKLNLSTVTIFYMRHKFLTMLETLLDSTNTQLEGYTELDECYINDSYKDRYGSFKEFPSDRKPRKHGAYAIKRGISNEKICINCGADRDGHVVIEASNRAKASSEKMIQVFKDKIKEGSVIINDGFFCYQQLIQKVKGIDIVKNNYLNYDALLHLNTINMIHSKFKEMIRYYRDVASKYLKRYISLFILC